MTEPVRRTKQPNWGAGTRTNSTYREAMIEAFRQHFAEPLSKKEAGQLFDKYLRNRWIDIWWNDHTGKYVVTMTEAREGSSQPVANRGL
jgi:hypothetical protein